MLPKFPKQYSKILYSILALVCSFAPLLYWCIRYDISSYIFICRFVFLLCIAVFVIVNIWVGFRKVWNWVFKYRYLIGLVLFAILVCLGVSTSSLGVYNSTIQQSFDIEQSHAIFGSFKDIRTDEYVANIPTYLATADDGTFSEFNDRIMATYGSLTVMPKVPTWNLSILATPNFWGFLFLDLTRAVSFNSLLIYFLSFFAVFETLLLVTKQKKLISLAGTLLLVFSPVSLWWNCQCYFTYGFICLLLFNKLITEDCVWKKLILSILIGWSFACLVMLAYPAWLIPYCYFYLVLLIWIIADKFHSIKWMNLFYLCLSLVLVAVILCPGFMIAGDVTQALSNTVYPGKREDYGGTHGDFLFNWIISPLYDNELGNNVCEFSQITSFYPLPIIAGIVWIINNAKNKKNDLLLILLVCFAVVLSVWNFIPIGFLAKITLMTMSTTNRSQIVVGVACVFIIMRILSYDNSKQLSIKTIIILSLAIVGLMVCAGFIVGFDYSQYSIKRKILYMILFASYFIMMLCIVLNYKMSKTIFCVVAICLSCYVFYRVIPVSSGIDAITAKPVSQEIKNIKEQNYDANWIASNAPDWYPNYALANNVKVINSVNFYPNLERWHKLDPEGNYEYIYNRYAHIGFNLISEGQSSFELVAPDAFSVNCNVEDLKKLDVNYIYSQDEYLDLLSNDRTKITKLYDEDKSVIYKVDYLQ